VGKRSCGPWQPERDARVDAILVLTADRDLKLVAWPVEVEELAHVYEGPGDGDRHVTVGSTARLGVLAQPVRIQQRRKSQREEGQDDSADRRQELHQKRK
jgi:hypothetical protein